jgi:hypothetical protein
MTKCRVNAVWHETGETYGGRAILVAESPLAMLLRLKGTRQKLAVPWRVAWLRGSQLEAARRQGEKVNRRRSVRRGALA